MTCVTWGEHGVIFDEFISLFYWRLS